MTMNEDAAPADLEQQSVIDLPLHASSLVVGQPGSGKTTALVARAVHLLRSGICEPDELVVLTPSRQTATRLRDEISLGAGVATSGAPAKSYGSFAFQLLRGFEVRAGRPAPQLLTGAEEDRIMAEMLDGDIADGGGATVWPDSIPDTVRTAPTFRSELRALAAECANLGLTYEDLREIGERTDKPEWVAASEFLSEYAGIMRGLRPSHRTSAMLIHEASRALHEIDTAAWNDSGLAVAARLKTVLIDDVQEFPFGTRSLLAALKRNGVGVVAFGDPDIGSGAFRGITPQVFRSFAELLQQRIVLHGQHRESPAITRLARLVTGSIGTSGQAAHRSAPGPEIADERVRTVLAESPFAEVDAIAYALRSWHLSADRIPYSAMAVIAHDTRQVARLEEELAARDIPTRAAGVQRPLGREIVVRDLLEIVALAAVPPAEREPEAIANALLSAYGGLDAVGLRRLRGALRHRELADGGTTSAMLLLRDAMMFPVELAVLELREAKIAERFAVTLQRLTEAHERGETIHELLWLVWERARVDGKSLADTWRERALTPGPLAAETSRALDSLVALFEVAKRTVERDSHADPLAFVQTMLESDVPEDTLAPPTADATVTLLTPASALGHEFEAVVIAGVQDGVWPNVRLRDGLFGVGQLHEAAAGTLDAADATIDRRREVLGDELRLFVRAITRARSHVLLTAVDDDDLTPSQLFSYMLEPVAAATFGGHPLTLRGLVARHRRTLTEASSTVDERAHAAAQLRLLADERVPGAAPEQWFGVADATTTAPLRDAERAPVPVSPSTIERFEACGIDWAVRALGGDTASWSGGLGTILHAAMEQLPNGDLEQLQRVVDERWGELEFEAPWLSVKEQAWAKLLVERLHSYLSRFRREEGRRVGAEAGFELYVPLRADATEADIVVRREDAPAPQLDDDAAYAVLRGSIDRVEVYAVGKGDQIPVGEGERVMVADLKTSRSPQKYTDKHVADDAQLLAYQLAVRAGAVDGADPAELSGARLILLSQLTKGAQYRFAQQPALDGTGANDFVERIVDVGSHMAKSIFEGDVNAHCTEDRFAICTIHTIGAVSAS